MYTSRATIANMLLASSLLLALSAHAADGASHGGDLPAGPFTVGGFLRGLSGSGLILRNNKRDLAVSANGGFTFPGTLANGQPYSVTVLAQPTGPSQSCLVANGTGTVHGANVTGVVVSCTTVIATMNLTNSVPVNGASGVSRTAPLLLTFSAALNAGTATSGTVSLKDATGVAQPAVLGVSGSQLSTTPVSRLSLLTPYTLAVSTALRGSAGETLTKPVAIDFTTADGQWQTATPITTQPAVSRRAPELVVDRFGNALAVWGQQPNSQQFEIWANRYTVGAGWGMAQRINTGGVAAFNPKIAIDFNGNALAVWNQSDTPTGSFDIWSNRYTANVGWGSARLVESQSGTANHPEVAFDANGDGIAVWEQSSGGRVRTTTARNSAATGVWGPAQQLDTNAGDVSGPHIATDANGNAFSVWAQFDGTRFNLWADRYTAATGWGTAALIETSDAGDTFAAQLAADANGNAFAIWHESGGANGAVWANRYTVGGGWGTAQKLQSLLLNADPQIAVDANGNAAAVWEQLGGGHYNVWSSHFTPATGWSPAAPIESHTAGDTSNLPLPKIAVDRNGNALVVWQQTDGVRESVWSNRFSATAWGTASLVETNDASPAVGPHVATDASGNAVAVWVQGIAAGDQVLWSNRLE